MALIEDTANRQIARSAGKVMIALLLSNIANLVSLILNATTFGTQADMDAFVAANRVSETLFCADGGWCTRFGIHSNVYRIAHQRVNATPPGSWLQPSPTWSWWC